MSSPFLSTFTFTDLISIPLSIVVSGSAVGTRITTNTTNASGCNWECFIDNTSISWPTEPSFGSENNWMLCGGCSFQDRFPHRDRKRFIKSANFLFRSDSVCSICQRPIKSAISIVLSGNGRTIRSNTYCSVQ